MADNTEFMNNLNKEIDRRIKLIESGKYEPVIRMTKFDYILSSIIVVLSFALLVYAYCFWC